MKHVAFCLLWLGAAVAAPACGSEHEPGPNPTGSPPTSTPTETPSGTPPAGTPGAGTPGPETPAPVVAAGFPCDVHALMQTYCAGCHTGQMYTISFTTREHLLAPYRDGTLGSLAASLVAQSFMPKYGSSVGRLTAAQRDLFVGWVTSGMPAGTCGALTPPVP